MKLQALQDPAADAPLDLGAFLPYRLSVLANRVSANFSAIYATRFQLTIPDWRVMAVLGQAGGLAADDVCQRTEMDKVTVSRAIARLHARGLVRRGTAAQDRRRLALDLTARGRAIYDRLVPLARDYEGWLRSALTPDEARTLDRLLDTLAARALRFDPEGRS